MGASARRQVDIIYELTVFSQAFWAKIPARWCLCASATRINRIVTTAANGRYNFHIFASRFFFEISPGKLQMPINYDALQFMVCLILTTSV